MTYEKYAEFRDKKGLTDYAVAKQTGLDPSQFSNWKAGRYSPKTDKLAKIAKELDVTIEKLIEEE